MGHGKFGVFELLITSKPMNNKTQKNTNCYRTNRTSGQRNQANLADWLDMKATYDEIFSCFAIGCGRQDKAYFSGTALLNVYHGVEWNI